MTIVLQIAIVEPGSVVRSAKSSAYSQLIVPVTSILLHRAFIIIISLLCV
ncbi:hypothetical protein MGSAQ_000577 [marine sediment metagenome]|uniref:Uncharacterized protein n=1 Tax=marine sediment metagenome TaxID=412755 RepID=A0A1B6NWU6_9ZZZZ